MSILVSQAEGRQFIGVTIFSPTPNGGALTPGYHGDIDGLVGGREEGPVGEAPLVADRL